MLDFARSKEQLFEKYNTSYEGLSSQEARRRLNDFGTNEIASAQKKNYLKEYIKQYMQFFAVLLEVAALLAFVAHRYAPAEGNDILGYAIVVAVIINATFSFWQEYKADKAMEALLRLMPTMVRALRDGKALSIDAKWLVPGDVVLLEEGEKIAADGIILEHAGLSINTASLNGESRPSRRHEKAKEGTKRAIDAKNMVFAGTSVVSGSGRVLVVATAQATEFDKITTLTKNVQKNLTPMQKEVIHITRILTVIALGMGTKRRGNLGLKTVLRVQRSGLMRCFVRGF
ncbi:MAG: HAD-IC family P-type ATPase [Sulfurimonadaceae bacterium]